MYEIAALARTGLLSSAVKSLMTQRLPISQQPLYLVEFGRSSWEQMVPFYINQQDVRTAELIVIPLGAVRFEDVISIDTGNGPCVWVPKARALELQEKYRPRS